jgi:flavodoxin II
MGYADWFQDALGMLHDELIILGCDIVGYWPVAGYEFVASKGLTEDGDYFVGAVEPTDISRMAIRINSV